MITVVVINIILNTVPVHTQGPLACYTINATILVEKTKTGTVYLLSPKNEYIYRYNIDILYKHHSMVFKITAYLSLTQSLCKLID